MFIVTGIVIFVCFAYIGVVMSTEGSLAFLSLLAGSCLLILCCFLQVQLGS